LKNFYIWQEKTIEYNKKRKTNSFLFHQKTPEALVREKPKTNSFLFHQKTPEALVREKPKLSPHTLKEANNEKI
jgi:hypothetical protein